MLQVLCIISNPAGWTGGVLGGGEIKAVEVLKRWHSWGIRVETLETFPAPSLMMNAGYKVHTASLLLRRKELAAIVVNLFVVFLKYLWIVKYTKPRFNVVVTTTTNFTDIFPAWLFSKLWKTPLIAVFQISSYTPSFSMNYRIMREEGDGMISSLMRALLSLLVIRLAKTASAIFCLSKPIMEMLRELGFPPECSHLTSMGLNHEEIEAAAADNQRYDGIFLGRVELTKGVYDLLEAWRVVTEKRSNASLLIVGAGDFLEKAKLYVKESKMDDNVRFVGFVTGKEKYTYLKSGKVFIYPSRIKEGWGLAIAEAMACGLPVVCSENPVFLSVFGGCKGVVFVPIGDVKGIASAILHLLSDRETLRSCGEASKAYARKYSWESVASRELDVIRNICRSHLPK